MKQILAIVLALAGTAAAQPLGGPPSKTLERAIKLYDKKDFFSASIELQKVIDGETGDDAVNKQRAEFFWAKTIFNAGWPVGSLSMFDKIAINNQHTYQMASLKWVTAVIDQIDSAGSRAPLSVVTSAEIEGEASYDDNIKNSLRYHMGLVALEHNNTSGARLSFEKIDHGSKWYAPSRLALASMVGQLEPAAALPLLIEAAQDPGTSGDAAEAMAVRAQLLGRTAHDPSVKSKFDPWREALDKLAAREPMAAFEASRLALDQRGKFAGLALIDVPPVDAVAIGTTCVLGAQADGRAKLAGTVAELRALFDKLDAYDDNAEMYEAVTKLRTMPMDRPSLAAMSIALHDRQIRESVAWVSQIHTELDLLMHADKAWQTTQVAAIILQELTVQMSVAEADLGKMYRDRLATLRKSLDAIQKAFGPADGVAYEPVALGPKVKSGGGFVVTDELCKTMLVGASLPQLATGPTPTTTPTTGEAPVAGKHGCGGCSSGESSGWIVALGGAALLRRRRRRS